MLHSGSLSFSAGKFLWLTRSFKITGGKFPKFPSSLSLVSKKISITLGSFYITDGKFPDIFRKFKLSFREILELLSKGLELTAWKLSKFPGSSSFAVGKSCITSEKFYN